MEEQGEGVRRTSCNLNACVPRARTADGPVSPPGIVTQPLTASVSPTYGLSFAPYPAIGYSYSYVFPTTYYLTRGVTGY